MYSLKAKNERNEELELTHNSAYSIVSTDGFDPPDAVINTITGAGMDGSIYNSSRLEHRTITLTIAINSPALQNRHNLYKFFAPKSLVKLTYETEAREQYTEGYVQTSPVDLYAQKEVVQITVICPNPYLMSPQREVVNFSYIENLFTFPFSIDSEGVAFSNLVRVHETIVTNHGELPVGAVFRLVSHGSVTNPKIFYADTGESMEFDLTMEDGDILTVSTERGNKYARLMHEGVYSNCIGKLTEDSTFFELMAGDCAIVIDATSGAVNIETTVSFEEHYVGV